MSGGSLAGIRVVDLTRMLSGPYCTMTLADHGAEVLKVEPPDGDVTRALGPFMQEDEERLFGGYFQSINRNKRSIALDLVRPEARRIMHQLAANADVVVNNFRPGVMDRLDLGYERLRRINPRLVYASISGFGDPRWGASPYGEWPAYDVVAQAMGGVMAITGPDAETPTKVGPGIGDIVPAMQLAFGILAALRHADRTGLGQHVDIAMYESMIALCERAVYQYTFEGKVPGPEGQTHPFLAPFGMFQAKDGWIALAAHPDNFWNILADIMGRPDLRSQPHFATKAARSSHRNEVNALVEAWTCGLTKAELTRLLGSKVPFGPVNNVQEILEDPHVRGRHLLAEVEQPGAMRPGRIVETPIRLSLSPGGIRRRAPRLGEDTGEVLAQLGYETADIAALRAAKVVA